jgi:hypothetical protein
MDQRSWMMIWIGYSQYLEWCECLNKSMPDNCVGVYFAVLYSVENVIFIAVMCFVACALREVCQYKLV